MNRNPKHAAPSDLARTSMNTVILKVDRKTARDCAFCRNSETVRDGKRYVIRCTKGYLIQNAVTCGDFSDSRQPSKGAKE